MNNPNLRHPKVQAGRLARTLAIAVSSVVVITGAAQAAKKPAKRFRVHVTGSLEGFADHALHKASVTTRKQVGFQPRVPWIDLKDFFDPIMFSNGTSGVDCIPDGALPGQMNISWEADGSAPRAGLFVNGFADDPDNSAALYALEIFADGPFTPALDHDNALPRDLDLGQATSFLASHWSLTTSSKGKLRKFTCQGDSLIDDLGAFAPPVTITITRCDPDVEVDAAGEPCVTE